MGSNDAGRLSQNSKLAELKDKLDQES
jgi:hypothetical protein